MAIANTTPAAVPLQPGEPLAVTVPTDTNLLYWSRIWPFIPDPDLSRNDRQQRRVAAFRSLVRDLTATLTVNDEPVGLLNEVVHPNDTTSVAFWNIEESLPAGTHRAVLTLAFDDSAEGMSPPPCLAAPDNAVIPWDGSSEVKTVTEISVKNLPAIEYEATDDPLWGRKQVYPPIVTDTGLSVTGT